jgi:hypothetical protein
VTSGDYSAYHIDGVFNNPTLANQFIAMFPNNKMAIEEWILNPFKKEIRKGYQLFFVLMSITGETKEIFKTDNTYGINSNTGNIGFDMENNMFYYCMAKDKKHAIKITNEQRTMLIANNKWSKIEE